MRALARILTAGLASMLMLSPAAVSSGSEGERALASGGTVPLTILTINIHAALTDTGTDLPGIAREITAAGADVVLLQEVDRHYAQRSQWADQPRRLAELTGMSVAFGPAIDLPPLKDGSPRRQHGNAILVRGPILESANTDLPWESGTQRRALLRVTFVRSGITVDAYSTHLHYAVDRLRVAQAARVVEKMRTRRCPRLLGADLNALPWEEPSRRIAGYLADAWTEVGLGGGFTQPAAQPSRRVDYVFHDSWMTASSIRVQDRGVSDHRAVRAEVELSEASATAC